MACGFHNFFAIETHGMFSNDLTGELRWSRLFGQLPGRNKLKAGGRLLV
jgi:hypothetical protein